MRRRRRLAVLLAVVTVPSIGFVLYRAYSELPGGPRGPVTEIAVPTDAEAATEENAPLPEEIQLIFDRMDAEPADNPYVTHHGAPSVATMPDELDLRWPTGGRDTVTSPFGVRGVGFHHGVDIGCPLGRPIYAAAPGQVVWTGTARVYGNTVVIHHGYGNITLYAHLNTIAVRRNQLLRGRSLVGACGSTGRSTGPHVHLELRYQGRALDPLAFLP